MRPNVQCTVHVGAREAFKIVPCSPPPLFHCQTIRPTHSALGYVTGNPQGWSSSPNSSHILALVLFSYISTRKHIDLGMFERVLSAHSVLSFVPGSI